MTGIKKTLSTIWGSIVNVAKKVWTGIKNTCIRVATACSQMKNKYLYLFAAFVVLLAILTAVSFIIDSNISSLYEADASTNDEDIAWHYNSLYNFINTYDARYQTYLEEFERYEQGLGKKPKEIEFTGDVAMGNRIVKAAKNRAEGVATAMDEFWLTDGIDMLNALSSFVYNQRQTSKYSSTKADKPFFSLIQIIVLFGASIAMLAIIVKMPGRYNLGLSPMFGNNDFWYYLSLGSLILALPCAIYSLFGKSYTWSVVLFICFVFAQVSIAAFGQFTLRKHGMSKLMRFLLPVAGSYAFTLIFFLLGMLNASYYGTLGAMSLFLPKGLVYVILFVAPLWVNAAYIMNGSFMATALPYACFGITFSIFPCVVEMFEKKAYAIVLFYVAALALVGGAIALTIMLLLKLKKQLPYPADVACEMYEEGDPLITVPEGYTAAVKAKKEKKIEKKAAKNDFAFLDEPEKTEPVDENQNTPV